MPNKNIYVVQGVEVDYSRWLSLGVMPTGEATVQLADLCHPGRLSQLRSVTCELSLLQDGLRAGAVQVVTDCGYFLAKREGERIQLEFKGYEDSGPTKVDVPADEVMQRLDDLRALVAPVPV